MYSIIKQLIHVYIKYNRSSINTQTQMYFGYNSVSANNKV